MQHRVGDDNRWTVGDDKRGTVGDDKRGTVGDDKRGTVGDDKRWTVGDDKGWTVGVGPYDGEWPADPRLDPELLTQGDTRNVIDTYRYWRHEAIVADLDARRHDFHVGIENWQHDFNIGSIVRTANAFLAKEVHIIGRRRWNRRGAMVTDRYQHVRHHDSVEALVEWSATEHLPLVGIDNGPTAVPLENIALPRRCLLLFGQEGPGLSEAALGKATMVCSIAQFGSTRSINAGAAAAIAMHTWIRQHALTSSGADEHL